MSHRLCFSKQGRSLLLLFICTMLILTMIPTHLVQAATVEEVVDDTLASFSDGIFQRSALSSARQATPTADQTGAVQLARAGTLKPWSTSTATLPASVSEAGVVSLGNRLFVIGGALTASTETTDASRSKDVYWALMNPDDGLPIDPTNTGANPWQNTAPLPPVKIFGDDALTTGCGAPIAERSAVAATSVSTGGNAGFIYVMGGNARQPSGCPLSTSSYGVQIGAVAENGTITWREGPRLPLEDPNDPGSLRYGVEAASAVTVKTASGRTFVYLIGGLKRSIRFVPVGALLEGSNRVYYAEVNTATGDLGAWTRGQDIFTIDPGSGEGLWDATAVAAQLNVGNQGIYVTGGQQALAVSGGSPAKYNTRVYRATVGGDGALTWTDATGAGTPGIVSLNETLVGMAGTFYNGKMYLTGGRQPTQAGAQSYRRSALTTYVEDNLVIPELSPNQYFIPSENVLPQSRSKHGMAIVRATPTEQVPSAAWVYVVGGADENGQPTNTLFFGRIGGVDESDDNRLAPTGWYISNPLNIQISGSNVDLLEIRWVTQISRAAAAQDVKIEYRVSATPSGQCDAPDAFGDNWQALDASDDSFFSTDGQNKFTFPQGINASCLQYRAFFSTSNTTQISPSLLRVTLLKRIPGGPDLKTDTFQANKNTQGALTGLSIVLTNFNDQGNTQPADFAERLAGVGGGSFYVDLCISDPNQTITQPPTPPIVPGQECTKVYSMVNKADMGVGVKYNLSAGPWYRYDGPDTPSDQVVDLLSYFKQPGEYQVWIVIDSTGLVSEADGAKENNVKELRFNASAVERTIFIPLLRR